MKGHMGQVSRQFKTYRFTYSRTNAITGLPCETDEIVIARTQAEADRKAAKFVAKCDATIVGNVYRVER